MRSAHFLFHHIVSPVLFLSGVLLSAASGANEQPKASETGNAPIRRYDPMTQSLKPIAADKVMAGKIYNHYSPRHGEYVWAYARGGGDWSYALGPGSTEFPENFDLVTPPAITRALHEQRFGDWLARSRREGIPILARLVADGHWELLQIRSVRSHFDLDAGYRWEWHGTHQLGILHSYGRRWRYADGKYYPAR